MDSSCQTFLVYPMSIEEWNQSRLNGTGWHELWISRPTNYQLEDLKMVDASIIRLERIV